LINISPDDLKDFMQKVFKKLGFSTEDANICSDVLITSDLRGIESHGVGRLRMYVDHIRKGLITYSVTPEVIKETSTTAVVDGQHSIGMVVAYRSMELAITKAKNFGIGAVAVRNSTHFGIDGYYPLMAVKADMIGMSFTNARPAVAPTFSTQPVLGTNPIAFGAPTDEAFPFLFDAATSITQRGKIEVFNREEKPMNPGWVIDESGTPLENAQEILGKLVRDKAALLPLGGSGEEMGGHKGYGLSTIVEILSSCLQSGAFLHALSGYDEQGLEQHFQVGHFFLAINIDSFLPVKTFKTNIGLLLRELRNSRKLPGQHRIYTAGEKEYFNEIRIRNEGVPINKNLKMDLQYIQDILNIPILPFKDNL